TVDQAVGDIDMLNIERPVEARDDLSAAPIDRTVLGQSVAKAAGPLDALLVAGDDADGVGSLGLGEALLLGVGAEAFALLIVGVEKASEIGVQCRSRVVVHPRIAVGLQPGAVAVEHASAVVRTAAEDRVGQVILVALVDPVAVLIRRDLVPGNGVEGGVRDDGELLTGGEVVADVSVVDRRRALVAGSTDEEEDRDGVAAARAEHLPTLSAAGLPSGALVAAEVEHVDGAEFFGEGLADAGGGVALDPAAVGDEADDPLVADAIARPTDGAHV